MPQCKLCGSFVAKLAKCHIYPRALARIAAGDGPLLGLHDVGGQVRLARADAGLFDRSIVCHDCELRFKRADDCALNFRRAALRLDQPFELPHRTLAFPAIPANAALLHEFALSTLLRAHLSERPELSQVSDLEIFEEAKNSLFSGRESLDSGRQVAIIVTRGFLGEMAASPVLRQLSDFSFYELRMPSISFFVASTDSELPPGFSEIALKPSHLVTFWRRKWPLPVELVEVARKFDALGDRSDRMMR